MKDQLTMIAFVVILGIVAAAILVGTDTYTSERIANNVDYSLKSSILNAFDIETTEANVFQVYEDNISEETNNDTVYYYSSDGNVGFEFEGKGLWGPIRGFLTLTPDFMTIKGIQIIYHEETPGLGGVVAEQWYLDKYKGKMFDPEIMIIKDADQASLTEVDAITGATMTSNAFQLMLNESYQANKEVLD